MWVSPEASWTGGGAGGSLRAGDFGDLRKEKVVGGTSPMLSLGYSGSAAGEVLEDGTSSVALDLEKYPLEPERVW